MLLSKSKKKKPKEGKFSVFDVRRRCSSDSHTYVRTTWRDKNFIFMSLGGGSAEKNVKMNWKIRENRIERRKRVEFSFYKLEQGEKIRTRWLIWKTRRVSRRNPAYFARHPRSCFFPHIKQFFSTTRPNA